MKMNEILKIAEVVNKSNNVYLYDRDGQELPKDNILHLVIVRDANPERYNYGVSFYDPANDSDMESIIDSSADIDPDRQYAIIRKRFNIEDFYTNEELDKDQWYIIPIMNGMKELCPLVLDHDPKDPNYNLYLAAPLFDDNDVLADTGKTILDFLQEEKYWRYMALAALNKLFASFTSEEYKFRFSAVNVFHNKRQAEVRELKESYQQYKLFSKERIKIGNSLINLVYNHMGKKKFDAIKISVLKKKGVKVDKLEPDKLKEAMDSVKVIDLIYNEYKSVSDLCRFQIEEKIDFDQLIKICTENELDFSVKAILDFYKAKTEQPMDKRAAVEFMKASLGIPTEGNMKKVVFFKDLVTKVKVFNKHIGDKRLRFIDCFSMFQKVAIYGSYVENEDIAFKSMKEEVYKQDIWKYWLCRIKGMGEKTAAAICAYLDPYVAIHPSGFIRYLGMDQVPDEADKDRELEMEDMRRISLLLFNDIRTIEQEQLQLGKKVSEHNYGQYFKTDCLETYSEYITVRDTFNQFTEKLTEDDLKIMMANEAYMKIIEKVFHRFKITFINDGKGGIKPVIKKHARNMSTPEWTTYITKDGKLKIKKTLGYNAELKAKINYVSFTSMIKAKSQYCTVYNNSANRYRQDIELQLRNAQYDRDRYAESIGPNPTPKEIKNLKEMDKALAELPKKLEAGVKRKARRRTMQILIEDLWLAWHTVKGLPLNGGRYINGKLNHYHRIGDSVPAKNKKGTIIESEYTPETNLTVQISMDFDQDEVMKEKELERENIGYIEDASDEMEAKVDDADKFEKIMAIESEHLLKAKAPSKITVIPEEEEEKDDDEEETEEAVEKVVMNVKKKATKSTKPFNEKLYYMKDGVRYSRRTNKPVREYKKHK